MVNQINSSKLQHQLRQQLNRHRSQLNHLLNQLIQLEHQLQQPLNQLDQQILIQMLQLNHTRVKIATVNYFLRVTNTTELNLKLL